MRSLVLFPVLISLLGCQFNLELNLGPKSERSLSVFQLNESLKVDSNGSLEGTWLVLEGYQTRVDVDVNMPPTVVKTQVDNSLNRLKVVTVTEDPLDPKTIHIFACNPSETSQDYYLNQDLTLDDNRALDWVKAVGHQHTIAFEDFTSLSYTYSRSQDGQEDWATANAVKISHSLNDTGALAEVLADYKFTVREANHDSTTAMQAADNYQPVCFNIAEQVYDYYNASGDGVNQTINDQTVKAQVIGFKAKSDAGAFVYIKAQQDEADRYSLNPSDTPSEQHLVEQAAHLSTVYYDVSEAKLYEESYRNVEATFIDGTPHPDNKTEFQLTEFSFTANSIGFNAVSDRVGDEIDINYTMQLR